MSACVQCRTGTQTANHGRPGPRLLLTHIFTTHAAHWNWILFAASRYQPLCCSAHLLLGFDPLLFNLLFSVQESQWMAYAKQIVAFVGRLCFCVLQAGPFWDNTNSCIYWTSLFFVCCRRLVALYIHALLHSRILMFPVEHTAQVTELLIAALASRYDGTWIHLAPVFTATHCHSLL